MSLAYATVALNMTNAYTAMKNNLLTPAELSPGQTPYPRAPGTVWIDAFKLYYDNDGKAGTMSEANVVLETHQPLLVFNNIGNSCDTVAAAFSNAISAYWVAQIKKGAPQHLSSIVSVVNDAAKIAAPIKAYMCSQSSTLKTPQYNHLFQFIENQVKTIIWTVTETDFVVTSSYSVTVS